MSSGLHETAWSTLKESLQTYKSIGLSEISIDDAIIKMNQIETDLREKTEQWKEEQK